MEITENSKTLKFDANGLIPAIVQDHYTKEVLTLIYCFSERKELEKAMEYGGKYLELYAGAEGLESWIVE